MISCPSSTPLLLFNPTCLAVSARTFFASASAFLLAFFSLPAAAAAFSAAAAALAAALAFFASFSASLAACREQNRLRDTLKRSSPHKQ